MWESVFTPHTKPLSFILFCHFFCTVHQLTEHAKDPILTVCLCSGTGLNLTMFTAKSGHIYSVAVNMAK